MCFRLFGNRSFCYEKMQDYEKALADAELALNMSPGWVKGLYRKGRALAGLKVMSDASYRALDNYLLTGCLSNFITFFVEFLLRTRNVNYPFFCNHAKLCISCHFANHESVHELVPHAQMSRMRFILLFTIQTENFTF